MVEWMNKKKHLDSIADLDLQNMEEEFEQMKREMEEDKKNHDFSIPKEWDADFRAAMDEAFKKKKIRKGVNIRSKLAMAAAVVLMLFAGNILVTEKVQGNKLFDIVGKTSGTENERFEMFSTKQNFDSSVGMEEVITFEGETISELYTNIRSEMKRPMFQIDEIPVEYEIEIVEYDINFRTLNIQLLTPNGWIYITQKEQLENGGSVYQTEEVICSDVKNDYLQENIKILQGKNKSFYNFTIQLDKDILYVQVYDSLKVCEFLAKNFIYE